MAKPYSPGDTDAPDWLKNMYAKPALDFDPSRINQHELAALEDLTHDLCLDLTIFNQLFMNQDARGQAYNLGTTLMFTLERALLFRICMRFSALIGDRSSDRKGHEDRRVLSISEVIKDLGSARLDGLRDGFRKFYTDSGLELWRNKFAAHNDKAMRVDKRAPLLNVSADALFEQVQNLNDFINLLKDREEVHTDVDTVVEFGTGVDRFLSVMSKLSIERDN